MKIFSIYTEEVRVLKDEWFLKTLQDDWELNIKYLKSNQAGGGDYLSPGWYYCIQEKIKYIIEAIKDNLDDVILWADIDIQFFHKCSKTIEKAIRGRDIVFQQWNREAGIVNTGFMAIRCNARTLLFFQTVLKADFTKGKYADQDAVNDILKDGSVPVNWSVFPKQIFCLDICSLPASILLHHACCAPEPSTENGKKMGSIDQKIDQLQWVRKFVELPVIVQKLHFLKVKVLGLKKLFF